MTRELARELAAVGIRGRLRRRILTEAAEHVRDGSAEEFGDPRVLARQFAEVLGASMARRAAFVSFGALAVVGAAYAVVFVSISRVEPAPDVLGGSHASLGLLAAVGLVVLPQVSFVGGVLAPVARTPRLALRRAALGLAAGAASLGCALLFTWNLGLDVPWLWAAAPGLAAAAVAAGYTVRAARIRTTAAAPELALTWRQALAVAALAALAVGVAGASGGDPAEGVRNAVAESLACMSGFAMFGRAMGIRR